jgi:epoxyqueuosine reductase
MPGATTVVVAALGLPDPGEVDAERACQKQATLVGRVARYARYPSYSRVLTEKLVRLGAALPDLLGGAVLSRAGADWVPLLERALAERSGVGFVTESSLLAVPGQGTFVVLGELLLDRELDPEQALERRCRGCGACRKACPSGALSEPFVVEARRCVSYWTQTSGLVPRELRSAMGQWVFGCDRCQEVCPENRQLSPVDAGFGDPLPLPGLEALIWARGAQYRALVGATRLAEAPPNVLARNAVIALGNAPGERAEKILARVAEEHPSPLVRAHAAWGLGRYSGARVRSLLVRLEERDPDTRVHTEARATLGAGSESVDPGSRPA